MTGGLDECLTVEGDKNAYARMTEMKVKYLLREGGKFLAVSWYGRKNVSKDQPKAMLIDLLHQITQKASTTRLPIIIGGDFNITQEKVQDSIDQYKKKEKQQSVVDFKVAPVKNLDKWRGNPKNRVYDGFIYSGCTVDQVLWVENAQLTDHDPIMCRIKLPSTVSLKEGAERARES